MSIEERRKGTNMQKMDKMPIAGWNNDNTKTEPLLQLLSITTGLKEINCWVVIKSLSFKRFVKFTQLPFTHTYAQYGHEYSAWNLFIVASLLVSNWNIQINCSQKNERTFYRPELDTGNFSKWIRKWSQRRM